MEKIICSACGAAIVPNVTQPFLTCAYCDTAVNNPYYDASAAKEAAKPSLDAMCLQELMKMGQDQNLTKLDADCFGTPIRGIDGPRAGLAVSDAHDIYFLYEHSVLLLGFMDGLALTDGGVYYACDSGKGRLSWEGFINGAIACVDKGDENGTLRIGSTVELPVKSDKDSQLARFLVDFHNHMYQLHTGEAAPAAWAVTEPAALQAEEKDSLLGTLLPAVGTLLTASTARKTIAQRTSTMRPTSHPTAPADRRNHVTPPRPLHSQQHHRPAQRPMQPQRTGMGGPAMRPGNPGRPGNAGRSGGMGRPVGPGGPGRGRR